MLPGGDNGEDLVSKINLSPPPTHPPPVASAAVDAVVAVVAISLDVSFQVL